MNAGKRSWTDECGKPKIESGYGHPHTVFLSVPLHLQPAHVTRAMGADQASCLLSFAGFSRVTGLPPQDNVHRTQDVCR